MRERSSSGEIAVPRFTIVVPTYQRRDLVLALLQSLAYQEFNGDFEVVVVVDGSDDGSTEALQEINTPFPLTVLEQSNQGGAAARNTGAAAARGEILLFLDDDMEAHPRLLAEHDHSHREGADVVLGHIPLHPKSPSNLLSAAIKRWAHERAYRLSSPGVTLTLQDLLTGQVSLRKSTFCRLGGFDTNFTRGGSFGDEDIDLGYRLMLDGRKIVFNPAAISWQKYVVEPRMVLRQSRQTGHADVAFARKHPDQAKAIFALHDSERWTSRWVWRPIVRVPLLTAPLMAVLRFLAIAIVKSRIECSSGGKLFFGVHSMEYWKGVQEAGGIPRSRPLRVLAYHAVRDEVQRSGGSPWSYGVPPDLFRRQLDTLLHAGFQFVNADEFLRFLHDGADLPRRPTLLTFDDGYEELSDVVLPLLMERGIPAVAFAVSNRLGMTNDWDEAIGAPRLRLLSVDGFRGLAREGIEIGAHSRTHRHLTPLPDHELHQEISGSASDLEAAGLNRPRLFAYPYGEWDRRVREAVEKGGFEAAFTTAPGRVHAGDDSYQLPRIEIMRGDIGWKFLWKVLTAGLLANPLWQLSLVRNRFYGWYTEKIRRGSH